MFCLLACLFVCIYVYVFVCLFCVCFYKPLATLEPDDGFLLNILQLLYH